MNPSPAAKALGIRLKGLRVYRRLTIDDLAAKTGLNRSTISNLEMGKYLPTVKTLLALDEALGQKVEDFELLETA